ncbi:MAG: DUF4006 domain-containing protein [Sulfurovum sp.]|nr:MAG: DUF4006 domain-containing protein [Sulfurovum sp.]
MTENTKRSLFGLNGIFGILISIVGLIVILGILMTLALAVQRNSEANPYDPTVIRDIHNLKMISVDNKQYAFVSPKNKDK